MYDRHADPSQRAGGKMQTIVAVQRAIAHAKRMCFPFNLEIWLPLGVIIFLDLLTGAGPSGGMSFTFNTGNSNELQQVLDDLHFQDFSFEWNETAVTVGLMAIGVIMLLIALRILLLYLGCRGQFMFIRAVAHERHGIGEQWIATGKHALSLFWFYLEIMLFTYAFYGVLLGITFVLVRDELFGESPDAWRMLMAVYPMILVGVLFALGMGIVKVLTRHFVAPLMMHLDVPCWEAWGHVRQLFRGNVLSILGLLILQWVYTMAMGIAALLIGCCTCGLALLPVIGHAVFAPFYVFDRSISLFMLEQYNLAYSLFPKPEPPPVPDL